ncbi:MAG: molybdenum cofactor guanylyltransferase [Opitutus sp.]
MNISAIYISTGHNFFGRHGKPAGDHVTQSVSDVECVTGRGLKGDRFWEYKKDYAGQVTFFDEEVHRTVLRELKPTPRGADAYRRNVITIGADLPSLIGKEFDVQGVRFLGMGESKPCYWMEQAVATGAEKFLRGRGGLRARILSDGILRVNCATEAGLLLAGGRSRRMGQDKAQVSWQGAALGEHQAQTLAVSGAWPLFVGCRPVQTWSPTGYTRLHDPAEATGALAAVAHALSAIDTAVLTVLAIDLPLVTPDFLQKMATLARLEGISVVPRHRGLYEPVAAAWHRSSLPAIETACQHSASFQDACARLCEGGQLRAYELDDRQIRALTNVNTPTELASAEQTRV